MVKQKDIITGAIVVGIGYIAINVISDLLSNRLLSEEPPDDIALF